MHATDGAPGIDCDVCLHFSGADDALAVGIAAPQDPGSLPFKRPLFDQELAREALQPAARGPPLA